MEFITAFALGVLHGVSSFLPVTPTSQVAVVGAWLAMPEAQLILITACVHIGTAIAVLCYFFNDLVVLLRALLRKLGRLPVNERDLTLLYSIVVATIPAALIGYFLDSLLVSVTIPIIVISILLFFACVVLMYVEWKHYTNPKPDSLTIKNAFIIGLFQIAAVVPGFSRTGAALAGGMLLGLSRYEAARFSFLLTLPIIFGIGIHKGIEVLQVGVAVQWPLALVAAASAAVTTLIVIRLFLHSLQRGTLWPFIWYGVILACFVGYISLVG